MESQRSSASSGSWNQITDTIIKYSNEMKSTKPEGRSEKQREGKKEKK